MGKQKFVKIGALLGVLAVIIGAFGAHMFNALLESKGTIDTFKTASNYHLTHAILLTTLGFVYAKDKDRTLFVSCVSLVFGIFIFSGTLYTLSLTGIKVLGAIAPIGGMLLIFSWLLIFIYAYRKG